MFPPRYREIIQQKMVHFIVHSTMSMATPPSSPPPALGILSLGLSASSDPPPTVVHHQRVGQQLALTGQPRGALAAP